VPRPLEAICLKAMALQPQDRYETALDLADDVERWLADEPVTASKRCSSFLPATPCARWTLGNCKFLTSKETNPKSSGPITWNFEKFLIGRDGTIVARFGPAVNPESEEVVSAIKKELAKK
jgi:hypothetical protein